MIPYTIYDPDGGRIKRMGSASAGTIEVQAAPDEALIIGQYDGEEHFVTRGRAARRPKLELEAVFYNGWLLATDDIPKGTKVEVKSRFYSDSVDITHRSIGLEVPDGATVVITPPWPYQITSFELTTDDGGPVTYDQTISVDLDRMKSNFIERVEARGQALVNMMLGEPDDAKRNIWKLKRSMRDRFLSGTNTASDDAAMVEATRYSGLEVQEQLDEFSRGAAREDWVTMRAEGIREETERRIENATLASDILSAVEWAETASVTAVKEAAALK